jgi:malonate transporter and related proteins
MQAIVHLFLEILLPVFFVLALGFYAGRRGRIDNHNTVALNTALMHFALPCSLFLGVARTPPAVLRSQSSLLGMLAVSMLAIYIVTFFLQRRVFREPVSETAVQSLTVAFSNNVAIGLPLLSGLYGPTGVLAVAAGIVSGALVISPITLVLLECYAVPDAGNGVSFQQRLLPAIYASVKRPIIIAPILGLLFPLAGIPLPSLVIGPLDLLGKATVGLALFLTGLILSAQPFRPSLSVFTGILLKNFVQPALIVALIFVFRVHGLVAQEAFLLAAVPAGFFGTVFGARYGIRSLEASSTLVLSTFLSIVSLPVAMLLAAHLP